MIKERYQMIFALLKGKISVKDAIAIEAKKLMRKPLKMEPTDERYKM